MIVPRPDFTAIADPPGIDPATLTEFQALAGSELAPLDQADAAFDLPHGDALLAIQDGIAGALSLGDDLVAAGVELDALLAAVELEQQFDFLSEGDLWDAVFREL